MGFDGRAGVLLRRRALRLSEAGRAALVRAPVVDDTGRSASTRIAGASPLRVLLFGSGALIGYGVQQRRDAVDGHLARLLFECTGRGVTVESRVRLGLSTAEAVQSLGGAGAATFHAVVWSPDFGEEFRYRSARAARAAVRCLLQDFRASTSAPLVVGELPEPLGSDWRTTLRRPRVAAFNALLRDEGQRVTSVQVASTGSYRPAQLIGTLGSAWHEQFARDLLPSVLRALRLTA